MSRLVLASLVAAAEAGTLAVTYSDCGAKHAHVDDLQPTTIKTGTTETLTGTGTSDEDVTAASFTATVSALGAQLSSCNGDGTKDIVCSLPMGVGKITVKALSFPIAKGTVSIPVEVKTSALIPASLASVDVHIDATDQNAESVICLDVHTQKQGLDDAAAGACSADEQAALADPQVTGKKANDCGTSSYNVLTGNFNHDKFNSCFTASAGISTQCSECYAATGEYGAKNCKADCLLGWCKSGCLSCTEPAQETLAACTGFTASAAQPCEELTATGACSADEQAALADPQVTGKKANDCGTSSYNVLTGNFNHDKFNSCFTASAGISTQCSECYAATGEYGAKNCKADCLLGWCKSGCLSCTEPAQETLAACTGFTASTAQPCEELTATGACSADEQAALADPQVTGKKANDCGTSSYNVLTGNFNHDKFNSCFTASAGISTQCSECYAATGEYGAKNCKADCLLGWCKSGCLSCTEPAQETLAACTGFTAATADPCETVTV